MTDPAETAEITTPVAWQRWLSIQLVRLRKAAGVKQADAAKAIGASVGKLSYLEAGERPISKAELDKLLPLYGIPLNEQQPYLEAADAAGEHGWWDRWDDQTVSRAFRRYVGLEADASSLRAFHPSIIHGLLQTREYALAVIDGTTMQAREQVERIAELRMARQSAITREHRPIQFEVTLDEGALRRRIGGADVLRDQLLHLANVAEQRENVTLRIVPFTAGAHAGLYGPFNILQFRWAEDHGFVFIDDFDEPRYLDSPSAVYRRSIAFDQLTEVALTPEESLQFIRTLAQ